jgi:hypothetical protein
MLERSVDERIDFLLERKIDTNPERLRSFWCTGSPFVGCLHQAWTTSGDDIAIEFGKFGGTPFGLFLPESAWLHARRTEDRDSIPFSS